MSEGVYNNFSNDLPLSLVNSDLKLVGVKVHLNLVQIAQNQVTPIQNPRGLQISGKDASFVCRAVTLLSM